MMWRRRRRMKSVLRSVSVIIAKKDKHFFFKTWDYIDNVFV